MRRRVLLIAAGATALAVFCAPLFGTPQWGAVVRFGPSMPHGVYVLRGWAENARPGDPVMIREPPSYAAGWLMKRAVGFPGDVYCWRPELGTHTLNDRPMVPPHADAQAHGVPTWTGCRRIEDGELVVYGDSADSYNSTYYGPVRIGNRAGQVVGAYRLVWPFAK